MTDNALKIAIAKALGWTAHRNGNSGCGPDIPACEAYLWEHSFVHPRFKGDINHCSKLPDWPRDLNACHEMEEVGLTTTDEAYQYHYTLFNIATTYAWHATARQRCEAFLKVKGAFIAQPSLSLSSIQ